MVNIHLVRKYQLKFIINQPDTEFMCKFWKKNLKQINTDIIGYVTFLKE